eukprot:TRINITY_DN2776_c0_g1_i1.p1 TRINITY_DN2776_c0_g1~~TRINITY_DN2776_c0_g1_i1.p1  ORF type:complete len:254 (+),score=31.82 TRINITY_DN2776_c0_g1_i1:391-1152(+)
MPSEYHEDDGSEEQLLELDDTVDDNPSGLPITHEVELKAHEGHVTALALDKSGSRLVSGGYDSTIKFWDFNAMDNRLKSFRSIEPPTDVISMLNFSPTGDRFIMASNSPQARVYDRDGKELVELPKGYPYISDMANTKGHINHITAAHFHPKKDVVITSSLDCSIRFWCLETFKKHKDIIKLKNAQGAVKSGCTTCSINPEGTLVGATTQNGELHFYPLKYSESTCTSAFQGSTKCQTRTGEGSSRSHPFSSS